MINHNMYFSQHILFLKIQYIMLEMSLREEADPKTIGQLFYLYCDENPISSGKLGIS